MVDLFLDLFFTEYEDLIQAGLTGKKVSDLLKPHPLDVCLPKHFPNHKLYILKGILSQQPKYKTRKMTDAMEITVVPDSTGATPSTEQNKKQSTKKKKKKNPIFCNIRMFAIFVCAIFLFHGALVQYSFEVIEHVGRRYPIAGFEQSFILGLEKIGMATFLIFMAFFGNRVHRPFTVGAGCIITSIGTILCATAYFISGEIDYKKSISNFLLTGICRRYHTNETLSNDQCLYSYNLEENKQGPFSLLCIGQLLIGIGSALFTSLALVHIEENSEPREATVFIGKYICIILYIPQIVSTFKILCQFSFEHIWCLY